MRKKVSWRSEWVWWISIESNDRERERENENLSTKMNSSSNEMKHWTKENSENMFYRLLNKLSVLII